jgi:hypothetical protein
MTTDELHAQIQGRLKEMDAPHHILELLNERDGAARLLIELPKQFSPADSSALGPAQEI